MSKPYTEQIFSGTIWAAIDKLGTMALQFIVNLILARLLMPADFGIIGMLYIFIAVAQTLIDGGFGSALIQKKQPSQTDYSTVFCWNILFSLILYGILYFSSPFIARFYRMAELALILRILGLILIINAFSIVQNNRLRKHLEFKTIAIINCSTYLIASIIAISFAYYGSGVWSLVILQIIYSLLMSIALWIYTHWKPSLCISIVSLKELFGYGGFLLMANLLQEICKNLQGLIIGRKFSSGQMGLYTQAYKLESVASVSLSNIIVQVMFPVFSQLQNDIEKLNTVLDKNIRHITFCIFPLITLLIIVANPLILFLYGENWIDCVPYFQVLCVGGLFACLQNVNYYVIAALGHSRTLFFWSIYKWSFLVISLFIGAEWGIYGILWGIVISNINIYVVNVVLVKKYSGYKISKQLFIVIRVIILLLISYFLTYVLVNMLHYDNVIIYSIVFSICYFLFAYIFKFSELKDIENLILK